MEIIIEQKAYEDLRKLVKKLKEVSDEYKEVKDETLLRILTLAFTMNKIREEKIKNKILKEIEKLIEFGREWVKDAKNRDDLFDEQFGKGYLECAKRSKDLIKKAFEGVEE